MALQTPIIKVNNKGMISPFNAIQDYFIEFIVIGGDQTVKTQLQIYDNDNILKFDNTIPNFTYKHLVPANTLVNSTNAYKARIRTYNINDEISNWSDYTLFKCLSDSVININNIINGKINNQTEIFTATYSQAENSQLESYKYYLYDENRLVISYSLELFDRLLQYQFAGFENGKQYYIELRVISEDELEATTGLIPFMAQYIQPKVQNVLKLENDFDNGAVKLTAKVTRALGHVGNGEISYEDNEYINLQNGMIYFDSDNGFKIDQNNYTLKLWCKNLNEKEKFLILYGKQGQVYLMYQYNKIYLYKTGMDGTIKYTLFKEIGDVDSIGNNTIFIFLQENNGLMNLECQII